MCTKENKTCFKVIAPLAGTGDRTWIEVDSLFVIQQPTDQGCAGRKRLRLLLSEVIASEIGQRVGAETTAATVTS